MPRYLLTAEKSDLAGPGLALNLTKCTLRGAIVAVQ